MTLRSVVVAPGRHTAWFGYGAGDTPAREVTLPGRGDPVGGDLSAFSRHLCFQPGTVVFQDLPGLTPEAFTALLRDHGWKTTDAAIEHQSGWWTCTQDEREVHVSVRAWQTSREPFLDDAAPAAMARRLAWWHDTTGQPYRTSLGVATVATILASLREMGDGKDKGVPTLVLRDWDAKTKVMGQGDIHYRTTKPHNAETVWQWDMRSAYLASAAQAYLAYGPLRNTGNLPADTNTGPAAGYYRIIVDDAFRLVLNPNRIERDGSTWCTHEMIRYLRELGHAPLTVDSWTARTSGRLLRTWAEWWRDLQAGHPRQGEYLKAGYAQAFGMMASPGGLLYRRDWNHAIEDRTRVSLLRRIGRLDARYPVLRINVDAVQFAEGTYADRDAIAEMIGEGPHIGNMKFEGMKPWDKPKKRKR